MGLVAYSDADWAGCPDTRRSTSSYSIFLGNNLVSWSAKKQPIVSRSSCESKSSGYFNLPASSFCDNKSVIFELQSVSHKRVKHIDLDYHFLHELIVTAPFVFNMFRPTYNWSTSSPRVSHGTFMSSFDPSFEFVLIPLLTCGGL
ncbi:hypothetical protein AAG906_003223 [Vitis piasezkii]